MDSASAVAQTGKLPEGYVSVRSPSGIRLAVSVASGLYDVGVVADERKIDLPRTAEALVNDPSPDRVWDAVNQSAAAGGTRARLDPATLEFAPCLRFPEKVICVGMNYHDHAADVGAPIPPFPLLFNKFSNALIGHNGVVELPRADVEQFDYEVELVLVIGKTTRNVSERDALKHVFGYCVGNDLTTRDLLPRSNQIMLAKISDGFGPIGPVLVPAAKVPDPGNLRIECYVNGERRQFSRTDQMIFSCSYLISYLSKYTTLRPGDLIFTGTPGGPVATLPEDLRVWLKAGDEVVSSIEGLGTLQFSLA